MSEATRVTFGKTVTELGYQYEDIVVLEADLGKSTHSFRFQEAHPSRYFQMGIAEANMIGTAAGLALSGKIPFICSFACFVTGRYDIIRVSIASARANVKIIGTHSGIAAGEDGNSQQGLEDLSLMRSLPGMIVMQPADDLETREMLRYAVLSQGPMYIRLTRQKVERVHAEDYLFRPAKADLLKKGTDVLFCVTGAPLYNVLQAAHQLDKQGVSSAVLNVHTIKPLDQESLLYWAKKVQCFLTVEDHNIIGGLGTAVAELLAETFYGKSLPLFQRIGLEDCFGESGHPADLYQKHNLSVERIVEKTLHLYSML